MDTFRAHERLEHCPGCGAGRIDTAVEPDIAQCVQCRLYFRNPRPSQAEIARSYDTGGTFDAWQTEESARASMWQRRLALVRRYAPSGRLLDVGTGDGRFLLSAREAGYEVSGTEVSKAGAEYAQKRGFDVHLGQITDLALPEESFDIATIWHVLEHVPDPGAVLRKTHSLLQPGGILMVAVPNEENFLVRKRFGQSRSSPFAPLIFGGEIHLSYFQPATLRTVLQVAGFDVLRFGVDDAYYDRGLQMQVKIAAQELLARLLHWHFAVAMYAVCRRSDS